MLITRANCHCRYLIALVGSAGFRTASVYPSWNRTCPIPVSLGGSEAEKLSSSSSDTVSLSDEESSLSSFVLVLERLCAGVSDLAVLVGLQPLGFCMGRVLFVALGFFRPFGLRRVSAVIAAARRGRSVMLYVKCSELYCVIELMDLS